MPSDRTPRKPERPANHAPERPRARPPAGSVRADFHVQALQGSALFAGLAPAGCGEVARRGVERKVRRKEAFFVQGDSPCALHLLLQGQVALLQAGPDGHEVILRLVGPGQVFAEIAALQDSSYPATARAVRPSVALVWDRRAVEAILEQHPRVARNAIAILLGRLREVEDRLREVSTERVARRLARTLLRLVQHAGRRTARGVVIDMPLTRESLAQLTGTTLFTVSRLLSGWEDGRNPHGRAGVGRDPVEPRPRDARRGSPGKRSAGLTAASRPPPGPGFDPVPRKETSPLLAVAQSRPAGPGRSSLWRVEPMRSKKEGSRARTVRIDARARIAELLGLSPEVASIFARRGMQCIGCVMAPFETLREAADAYRFDPREMLREIRAAAARASAPAPLPVAAAARRKIGREGGNDA
jgi:hybrid cluster-associated redox disulfide protein